MAKPSNSHFNHQMHCQYNCGISFKWTHNRLLIDGRARQSGDWPKLWLKICIYYCCCCCCCYYVTCSRCLRTFVVSCKRHCVRYTKQYHIALFTQPVILDMIQDDRKTNYFESPSLLISWKLYSNFALICYMEKEEEKLYIAKTKADKRQGFLSLAAAATSLFVFFFFFFHQSFCSDKHVFVARSILLSRPNICRDKSDTCGSSRQW